MTNSSKILKKKISDAFLTVLLGSLILVMGYKIHLYDNFSRVDFIYLTLLFQG